MSVIGVKQVGHLLIGETYHGNAGFSDFNANAVDKALQVVSKDSATLQAGKFKVFQKATNTPGGFEFSEVIDPKNIEVLTVSQYTAPINRVVKVTGFTGTVRGNVTYEVFIRLLNDGGTLSPENFRHILGAYVTPQDASGLTFTDVLNGIKLNLDKTLSRESNTDFTITLGADELIVTGGSRDFVLGKKDGRPVEFDLMAAVRDNGGDSTVSDARYDDLTVVQVAAGNAGSGTGNQVASLEWCRAGEKGDRYRTIGYPNNFDTLYYANPGTTYHLVNIAYFEQRDYTTVERQYRVLQIAVENADQDGGGAGTVFTAVNALIADLNTATGLSLAALV
jgi:hypothetical protein|tara:strand:+ start:19957 stop:20964 length:1008 start_codon:yes stop_codon:yes gene_type:complete